MIDIDTQGADEYLGGLDKAEKATIGTAGQEPILHQPIGNCGNKKIKSQGYRIVRGRSLPITRVNPNFVPSNCSYYKRM